MSNKKIAVRVLRKYGGFNVNEVAGFDPVLADQLVANGDAEYIQRRSKREKIEDTMDANKASSIGVDWAQIQRVTKELTGRLPNNKKEVIEFLGLEENAEIKPNQVKRATLNDDLTHQPSSKDDSKDTEGKD